MSQPKPIDIDTLHSDIALSDRERASQTKMITRLFTLWKLTPTQQSICLGLSTNTRTNIHKYQTGKAYLPLYRDIQERIKDFLIIHKQLKQLFPKNPEIAYQWMKLPNRAFDHLTPIDLMNKHGIRGLITIRNYLDQALTL